MTSIPAIFRALNRAGVRYVLIGGYASVVHGVLRTTVDVDLALNPDPENVGRALRGLLRLGLEPERDRVDEILGLGGVSMKHKCIESVRPSSMHKHPSTNAARACRRDCRRAA